MYPAGFAWRVAKEAKDLMTRTTERAIVKLFNVQFLPPDDEETSCRQRRQWEKLLSWRKSKEARMRRRRGIYIKADNPEVPKLK